MYIDDTTDFYKKFYNQCTLTTVLITYRIPDYQMVLQEFLWQTLDFAPKYPRIMQFVHFWEHNIDGPIHSVQIGNDPRISPDEINFEKWI